MSDDNQEAFKVVREALAAMKALAIALEERYGTDRDFADECSCRPEDSDPVAEPDDDWQAFLDEHRELKGCEFFGSSDPARAVYIYAGPYQDDGCLDRSIVAALLRCDRPEGLSRDDVLRAMFGTLDEAQTLDHPQSTVGRLMGLAARGIVTRTPRQGAKPALWRINRPKGLRCHTVGDDGRWLCGKPDPAPGIPAHNIADCEREGHLLCPICEVLDA